MLFPGIIVGLIGHSGGEKDLGFGVQAAMLGSIDGEIGGFLRQIRAHGDALHMVNMGMR